MSDRRAVLDSYAPVPVEEIAEIRAISRLLVRRLGLLRKVELASVTCSASETHMLVELSRRGPLGQNELAQSLELDKSSVSRLVRELSRRGSVEVTTDPSDARARRVALSEAGRAQVRELDASADLRVGDALRVMGGGQRESLRTSLGRYVQALGQSERLQNHYLRPLQAADDSALAEILRSVRAEFELDSVAHTLLEDRERHCSQLYGGVDREYWVVEHDVRILGGIGFGPFGREPNDTYTCEIQRFYLEADARGLGLGRKLIEHALERASALGYRRCYIETVGRLRTAHAAYLACGFRQLDAPLPGSNYEFPDHWFVRELD